MGISAKFGLLVEIVILTVLFSGLFSHAEPDSLLWFGFALGAYVVICLAGAVALVLVTAKAEKRDGVTVLRLIDSPLLRKHWRFTRFVVTDLCGLYSHYFWSLLTYPGVFLILGVGGSMDIIFIKLGKAVFGDPRRTARIAKTALALMIVFSFYSIFMFVSGSANWFAALWSRRAGPAIDFVSAHALFFIFFGFGAAFAMGLFIKRAVVAEWIRSIKKSYCPLIVRD
jgi:hypothetical protein